MKDNQVSYIIINNIVKKISKTLNYNLSIIDEGINSNVIIMDNSKKIFPSEKLMDKQKIMNFICKQEIGDYYNEVGMYGIKEISDLGEYCIAINIDNLPDDKNVINYIEKIVKRIIKECILYMDIDIKGLLLYAEDINKCKQIISRIIEGNIVDYIDYISDTSHFSKKYKEEIDKIHIDSLNDLVINKDKNIDILNHLNQLSCVPYESEYSKGQIAIFRDRKQIISYINLNRNTTVEFSEYIELKDYKAARKLIQMSNKEWVILSDGMYIYGISKINTEIEQQATIIKFDGYYTYFIIYKEKKLVKLKYGKPIKVKKDEDSKEDKDITIKKIKKQLGKISKKDEENLITIIEAIKKQKKGSMLVISKNAEREAYRLRYQSTRIKPQMMNKEIINSISSIDGSIIIDKTGTCYSIGVILDGLANIIGDKARGARYNSAIKYVDSRAGECIAIVISEDGMVDIIDQELIKKLTDEAENLEKLKKQVEEENQFVEELINSADYIHILEDESIEKYIKYILSENDDENSNKYKASFYYNSEMYFKSINCIEKNIKLNPTEPENYHHLGVIYNRLSFRNNGEAKNYDEIALGYFKKASELDKKNPLYYREIGNVYYNLKEYENSKENFEESLKLNPQDSYCHYQLGELCSIKDKPDYKGAISHFINATKYDQNNAQYFRALAISYYNIMDFDNAIKFIKEAIILDPQNIDYKYQLGLIYLEEQKNYDVIIEYIDEFLSEIKALNNKELRDTYYEDYIDKVIKIVKDKRNMECNNDEIMKYLKFVEKHLPILKNK